MHNSQYDNPKDFNLSSNTPNNLKDLFSQIGFLFKQYEKQHTHNSKLIVELINKKWWIVPLLKSVYWDRFDWESEKQFELNSLSDFLNEVSEIWWEIIWKMYSDSYQKIQEMTQIYKTSPLWASGILLFDDENVTTQDMTFLEGFFRYYLSEKWILKTQEAQDESAKNFLYYQLRNLIEQFLSLVITSFALNDNIKNSDATIQLLLLVHKNIRNYSTDIWESFIEEFSNFLDEDFDISKSWKLSKNIEILVKKYFPEIYSVEHTRYKVEAVILWDIDINDPWKGVVELIPEGNFYFDVEMKSDESNIFPESSKIIRDRSKILCKNANIFDVNGNKVFWWDIWLDDIKDIKGVYYILDEHTWWRDVPEFAQWSVRAIAPVKDEYGESIRKLYKSSIQQEFGVDVTSNIPNDIPYVLPEYIRLKALWKIQDGKYIENNIKISL